MVTLVVIFGLMTATSRDRTESTLVEKAISTLLYPLQMGTDWVARQFRGAGQTVQELTHLREENADLKAKVQQAEQVEARNQLLRQENQMLRGELGMKERAQYKLLTAQVISRTPDNWYKTVTINRGSREGVQSHMAVVNWQGLVGTVSQVTPFTATVQLVTDAGFGQTPGFGAGAKLPTGEEGVIVTVQGGHLRMNFFSSYPSVELGPVFTSGQGMMPPDLLIGYADSYNKAGPAYDKYLNVRPAVDFGKLDVVHVVMRLADKDGGATTP